MTTEHDIVFEAGPMWGSPEQPAWMTCNIPQCASTATDCGSACPVFAGERRYCTGKTCLTCLCSPLASPIPRPTVLCSPRGPSSASQAGGAKSQRPCLLTVYKMSSWVCTMAVVACPAKDGKSSSPGGLFAVSRRVAVHGSGGSGGLSAGGSHPPNHRLALLQIKEKGGKYCCCYDSEIDFVGVQTASGNATKGPIYEISVLGVTVRR